MSTFAIPTSLTCLNCACIHLVTSSVAGVEEPPCRSTIVLAGAAQGKLRQDREAPWQSMIRKYAAQPGAHIFKRRRWAAGCDHDRGTDDLAPLRVGAADDERLGHGIEQIERLLHRAWGHLEAAGVDQVVDPPVHDQRAAVIEVADVVGAEPCRAVRVFAEHRRSEHRFAEVALGKGGAAEPDPAVILEPHEADIKWPAVIDAAARRLAHAIRGDHMDPGVPGTGE